MCPQSAPDFEAPKLFMDLGLYRKIIDQIGGKVYEINLFFRGESLFHPQLPEMIGIAHEAGVTTNLDTNATILTEELSRKLIEAGLSKIQFSFDGATKEVYEKMRKGANFERTLGNVRNFLRLKQRFGSRTPHVSVQLIEFYREDKALRATEEFKDLFKGLGVNEWHVIWARNWAGTFKDDKEINAPLGEKYYQCNWLWRSLAVYYDGTVALCCTDFYGRYNLGDFKTQSLMEIWNGERMRQVRQWHRERKVDHLPCKECDFLWNSDTPQWRLLNFLSQRVIRNNVHD